jgi:hypothetical protein
MNLSSRIPFAAVLVLAFGAIACSQATDEARNSLNEAQQTVAEATGEGGAVTTALAEAREKLHTENLPIDADGLPKAELTPQGDLLIDGVAVPLDSEQRAAVLAYRKEVLAVADTGIAMGQRGAAIAGDALALAAKGLFGGDTSEGEAAIEAKGKAIAVEALEICKRVADLDVAGDRLAALLPAFKPYADKIDIEADCNVAETSNEAEGKADDAAEDTSAAAILRT